MALKVRVIYAEVYCLKITSVEQRCCLLVNDLDLIYWELKFFILYTKRMNSENLLLRLQMSMSFVVRKQAMWVAIYVRY